MNEEETTASYLLMRPKIVIADTNKFLNGTTSAWFYQHQVRVEFGSPLRAEIVEYGRPGQPERAVEAVANLLSAHGFEYDNDSWKEINGGYSVEVRNGH